MIVRKTNWSGSGKVGHNYQRTTHGVAIMAAMPVFPKDPSKTSAQVDQQTRFSVLGKLASSFLAIIKIGLKNLAKQYGPLVSAFDAFVKLNNDAVNVVGGEAEIDYGGIKVSKGNLEQPSFSNASFATAQKITATFATTSTGNGSATDKVYIVAYASELGFALISAPVLRSTGTIEMSMPATWVGLTVHVYGFVLGDGTENKGMVSESNYLGSGTIA